MNRGKYVHLSMKKNYYYLAFIPGDNIEWTEKKFEPNKSSMTCGCFEKYQTQEIKRNENYTVNNIFIVEKSKVSTNGKTTHI